MPTDTARSLQTPRPRTRRTNDTEYAQFDRIGTTGSVGGKKTRRKIPKKSHVHSARIYKCCAQTMAQPRFRTHQYSQSTLDGTMCCRIPLGAAVLYFFFCYGILRAFRVRTSYNIQVNLKSIQMCPPRLRVIVVNHRFLFIINYCYFLAGKLF